MTIQLPAVLKRRFFPGSAVIACFCLASAQALAVPAQKAPAPKAPARQENAWVLSQKTRVFGDQLVYITDRKVRIECPKRGAYTLSVSPFKKVFVVDYRNKTYYEADPESTKGVVMQRIYNLIGSNAQAPSWKVIEKSEIATLKAAHYVSTDRKGLLNSQEKLGSNLIYHIQKDGFWVAEDPRLPAKCANVLAHLNGLPPVNKVPLRFVYGGKKVKCMLDTTLCQRKPVSPAIFEIPRDYKKVSSEFHTTRGEIELFGDL